jgi:hypothetical protein
LKNFNAVFLFDQAYKLQIYHCTEVRFASFLSGKSMTAILVNPLEKKQAKRISGHWSEM